MYEIVFYEDQNNKSPIYTLLSELAKKDNKNDRIHFNKIQDYIQVLSIHGTRAGENYVKHIDSELWELRPLNHRIFFAHWTGKSFILLHHFYKKTQKTPQKEIEQARKNLNDILVRSKQNA